MDAQNTKQYKAGEVIFTEREKGGEMFILLKGKVELKKKVDTGFQLLKTVDQANEFFGEMALVDGSPRSATAVAAEDSVLLVVNQQAFENLVSTNGKFALRIIKALSERIRNSNQHIRELASSDQMERFIWGMVDFAIHRGEKIFNGGIKIRVAEVKAYAMQNIGVSEKDSEVFLLKLLKTNSATWAATSAQTREHIVLSEEFIKANNRRQPGSPPGAG